MNTEWPPRRAYRRRWFALAASLFVHLLLGLAILHLDLTSILKPPSPKPSHEIVTIVERLNIERKPRLRRPPPRPRVRREPPHRATAAAPVKSRTTAAKIVAFHPTPHELAKIVPRHVRLAPPVTVPREALPRLSDARIAQIQNSLGEAIANGRNGPDPLAVPSAPAVDPKHYGLDTTSFTEGDRNHHGLCDPVKDWVEGNFNYYYVACNVRFSDGTFERQSVPWPVRFPPDDDPFAGTSRTGEKPLALPLPGWTLPPGETITVELREYARDHGIAL